MMCLLKRSIFLRPNKNVHVFRVTQPYLNLPVKPRIFSGFSGKNIILCILKGGMPFKMHKISFFPKKNNLKKICVPTQPKFFRPVTLNTFFAGGGGGVYKTVLLSTQNILIEK